MKTTLKTLICTALCCAASSVFAVPAPTTTSIAFVDACATGNPVNSAKPDGTTATDVAIKSTTVVTAGGAPVTEGVTQFQIATDGAGNPVSTSYPTITWVRMDGGGAGVDTSSGQACFDVDLDHPAPNVNPVTCALSQVGFQTHYVSQGGTFHESFSDALDLTIDCNACGTNTNFTIGFELASGPGHPCPGSTQCWNYTMTVENCTATDLTNVKIQGGTAGWLNQANTTATSDVNPQPSVTPVGKGKNTIINWMGNIPKGTSVNITVHVCGTVAKTNGTTEFLSGPWSATGFDPNGNRVTTGYTGQVSITTDSTNCP